MQTAQAQPQQAVIAHEQFYCQHVGSNQFLWPPISEILVVKVASLLTMTKAYLLTWNSLRWPWPELAGSALRVAAGETVTGRWGCGRNTHIQPGDRLFLLKQGAEPRGIFASGSAVSTVFSAPHWDEEKAALGVPTNYIELQFDALQIPEESILRRDLLKGHPVLSRQYWDTQVSGITIKTAVLPELEALWAELR